MATDPSPDPSDVDSTIEPISKVGALDDADFKVGLVDDDADKDLGDLDAAGTGSRGAVKADDDLDLDVDIDTGVVKSDPFAHLDPGKDTGGGDGGGGHVVDGKIDAPPDHDPKDDFDLEGAGGGAAKLAVEADDEGDLGDDDLKSFDDALADEGSNLDELSRTFDGGGGLDGEKLGPDAAGADDDGGGLVDDLLDDIL